MTAAEKQNMYAQVVNFLLPYRPLYVGVFGSFAKNEERTGSDLDILVDFPPSAQPNLWQRMQMISDLETLLGRKVDLVKRKNLLPYIAEEVHQSAIQVYP